MIASRPLRYLLVAAAVVGVPLAAIYVRPGDIVCTRYPSLAAARADGQFEKGWLPDVLPASTTYIRTKNNLDLNVSEGMFRFDPYHYAEFVARTRVLRPADAPLAEIRKAVAAKRSEGLDARAVVGPAAIWVFFCEVRSGECEYRMWMRKA